MAYGPFNAGAGKGGGGSAADTSYDNSTSGIEASNVQDALDTVLGATLPRLTVKVAAGSAITITDGTSTITGTANTAGSFTTNLPRTGTWSVSATLNGESTDGSVNAASLGGNYTIELAYFAATLTVSAKAGTVVTASCNGTTYSGTVAGTGKATITIKKAGTYTVTGVYSGVASNSASVSVTTNGGSYTASLSFITLTVTVDTGSTITVKNGSTTLTDTSTGSNTFYLPNTGTWEVTASLNGQTATGSVNATAYQGYTLSLSYVSKTLNNNSWATIKKVSDANQGANYWAAGDTKTITINGKVGATTFSNLSIDAFISGFNHNSAKEGTGRIHFLIGKKNGKMVGLTDSSYGNQTTTSGAFTMNTSNTNSGGWASCHMRKTVLGADSSPSNPTANTLLAALPADLRAVMKSVTKYTDNAGNASNTAAAVTATTDYLWLLAEFEIQGTRSYANQYEQNSQAQYDYFKAGNSKIAYKYNDVSTAVWSRGRSAYYTNTNLFCSTATDGSAYPAIRALCWPALLPNPPQSYPGKSARESGRSPGQRRDRKGAESPFCAGAKRRPILFLIFTPFILEPKMLSLTCL
jgi:hypothetical protein